jgi:prevent-host-death family protein
MDEIVTIHVAKTTLSQLIARVEAGEEIIIARDKSPVARLVPIGRVKAKRQFGAMRGKASVGASFFEPLPDDELRGWE